MTAGVTMAVRKVTISVEASILSGVDRLAKRAGLSRSEWLAAAAERSIRHARLRRAVTRALAASGGPVSRAERSRALRDLGLAALADDAAE